MPEAPPEDARGGRPHPRSRGGGSDIRTLRDFSPGDDPRDLHWKQSARMRRWIVREREAERDRVLFLAIDNALPRRPTRPPSRGSRRAIARCAGAGAPACSRAAARSASTRAGVKVAARGPARRSGRGSWRRSRAWSPSRPPRRRTFRSCGGATCGGSCRDARTLDARRAWRAPTCWCWRRPRSSRRCRWRGPAARAARRSCSSSSASRSCGGGRARGRPVRVSDAAMNVAGLVYLAWLGYSAATLRPGLLPTVVAPAALHRPREARVPEASERGAAGPARHLPADARLGVVLDARVVGRCTSRPRPGSVSARWGCSPCSPTSTRRRRTACSPRCRRAA